MKELALPSLTFQDPKGFGAKEGVEKQVGAHPVTLITGKAKVLSAYVCRCWSRGITLTDEETEVLRGPWMHIYELGLNPRGEFESMSSGSICLGFNLVFSLSM